eukprot:212942-Alexandrium_andersonii.AAC.1
MCIRDRNAPLQSVWAQCGGHSWARAVHASNASSDFACSRYVLCLLGAWWSITTLSITWGVVKAGWDDGHA